MESTSNNNLEITLDIEESIPEKIIIKKNTLDEKSNTLQIKITYIVDESIDPEVTYI